VQKESKSIGNGGGDSSPARTRGLTNIIKHYEDSFSKTKIVNHLEDSLTKSIEAEDYVSKTFTKRKRNDSSNEDIKEVMDVKNNCVSP
tara:strand:+ start:73 stop:336 length:264 start_codon:yes stop_codon:yes gene_type:complete